jgi:hypothetical protein
VPARVCRRDPHTVEGVSTHQALSSVSACSLTPAASPSTPTNIRMGTPPLKGAYSREVANGSTMYSTPPVPCPTHWSPRGPGGRSSKSLVSRYPPPCLPNPMYQPMSVCVHHASLWPYKRSVLHHGPVLRDARQGYIETSSPSSPNNTLAFIPSSNCFHIIHLLASSFKSGNLVSLVTFTTDRHHHTRTSTTREGSRTQDSWERNRRKKRIFRETSSSSSSSSSSNTTTATSLPTRVSPNTYLSIRGSQSQTSRLTVLVRAASAFGLFNNNTAALRAVALYRTTAYSFVAHLSDLTGMRICQG